jgi:hypothetical protein
VPVEDVAHGGSPLLAEAITRLRAGRVIREATASKPARNPNETGTSLICRCCTRLDFVAAIR